MQEKTFSGGRISVQYGESQSSGPAFVALHGASNYWQGLLPLLEPLETSWHVFAPDLRGHGASGWQPGAYRITDFAEDVGLLLRDVVQEPAVVLGHSLGGWVALMVATQKPALVRALIIADTPLFGELHPQAAAFNMHLAEIAAQKESVDQTKTALAAVSLGEHDGHTVRLGDVTAGPVLQEWARGLAAMDPDVLRMLASQRLLDGYDAAALLAQVRSPLLLLQADPGHGANMSDHDVAQATAIRPDLMHVRLPGVGHALHQEDPEAVLVALPPFLAALP